MSLLPVLHEEDEEGDDSRPRRESLTANHKRRQSAYYQRQSIKPIDNESIAAKQKKISLNRDYTGKYQSNEKRVSLTERERLSKACHRPVIVPMVKIIGKVPGYVDVSELETLRREFAALHKEYHNVVKSNLKEIHRRHVELMEVDKIKSERLRKRFICTLKAYGISPSTIADVLAELVT